MFPCASQSYLTQPATAIRREGYGQRIRVSQRIEGGPAVALNFLTAGYSLRLELYIHQYTGKPVVLTRTGQVSTDGLEMALVLTATELQALPSDQYTEQVWLRDAQNNETLLVERTLTLHQTSPAGGPSLPVLTVPVTALTLNRTDRVLEVVLDRAVVMVSTGGVQTNILLLTSGEPIGLGILVRRTASGAGVYRASVAADGYTLAGISLGSALTGELVSVQPGGLIHIPGWGLTAGALYYAGLTGNLVGIPPASAAFLQLIGRAIEADYLLLTVDDPLFF